MKIGQIDTKLMTYFVDLIKTAGRDDEGTLQFTKHGLECMKMEPGSVAMINARIPKNDFARLSLKKDTEVIMCVDLNLLHKMLKVCGEEVELEYDEKERLMVLVSGKLRTTLGLVDASFATPPNMPNFPIQGKATVGSDDFAHAIKAAKLASDLAVLRMDETDLRIVGEYNKNSAEVVFSELEEFEFNGDAAASQFDITLLSDATKMAESDVKVSMGNDLPLMLTWTFGDNCTATYFLAPRVDGD